MISPAIIHRDGTGKKFYRFIHKPTKHLLFAVGNRNHVTVKQNQIGLFKVTLVDHILQNVVTTMNVIDHREGNVTL